METNTPDTTKSSEINGLIARITGERMELEDKICKLVTFMGTDKYVHLRPAHRIMLLDQIEVMKRYRDILDVRYDLLCGDLMQALSNEKDPNFDIQSSK